MRVDDADLRVRLEGRAELLSATRLRYRALVNALKGLRWKHKLRRARDVVEEVARAQPEVDEALRHALKRAAAERWPDDAELVRCLKEVQALRAELARLVEERLSGDEEPRSHLGTKLLRLAEHVLFAPWLVLPGERWALAGQLLSPSLFPAVGAALAFGVAVEHLFSRPLEPGHLLPFELDEWEALASGWPQGVAALDAALACLAKVDVTGGLQRAVLRRARHVPRVAHATGLQQVLHAHFWRTTALARVDEVLAVRLAPASARPHERFPLFRYLLRRERDALARLADEGVPARRAALLELAHELTALPQERPATIGGWDALLSRAVLADEDPDEVDWPKVRDNLRLLVRVVSRPEKSLPPLYRSLAREGSSPQRAASPAVPTLNGLLRALRERSDTLPVRPRRR